LTPKPWPKWVPEVVAFILMIPLLAYGFMVNMPLLFFLYYPAFAVCVAIHEAGHYFSARKHGFPVFGVILWGCERRLVKGSWRTYRARHYPWLAGAVHVLPKEPLNLPGYRKLVLAGMVANLVTAAIGIVATLLLWETATSIWIRAGLIALVTVNVVMVAASAVPYMTKMNLGTDGFQLKALSGPQAAAFLMRGSFLSHMRFDQDVSKLPFSWVEEIDKASSEGVDLYLALVIEYWYRRAEKKHDECEALLDELVAVAAQHAPELRGAAVGGLAEFYASCRGDTQRAREILERAKGFTEAAPGELLMVESVILSREGDLEGAKTLARESISVKWKKKAEILPFLRELAETGKVEAA
jgi:hypothetical protein